MAYNSDYDFSLHQDSYSSGYNGSRPPVRYWEVHDEIERISPSEDVEQPPDFISIITATQSLSVDLLPLTWEPDAAGLGLGATANVRQRPLDAHNTFAFKVLKDAEIIERQREYNQQRSIDSAYRVILNELIVLAHPKVREHPNMVELIGISFQIMDSDRVWPTLTTKRTAYGDLESFLVSDEGKDTSIGSRIGICQDIAGAIQYLHSHRESD